MPRGKKKTKTFKLVTIDSISEMMRNQMIGSMFMGKDPRGVAQTVLEQLQRTPGLEIKTKSPITFEMVDTDSDIVHTFTMAKSRGNGDMIIDEIDVDSPIYRNNSPIPISRTPFPASEMHSPLFFVANTPRPPVKQKSTGTFKVPNTGNTEETKAHQDSIVKKLADWDAKYQINAADADVPATKHHRFRARVMGMAKDGTCISLGKGKLTYCAGRFSLTANYNKNKQPITCKLHPSGWLEFVCNVEHRSLMVFEQELKAIWADNLAALRIPGRPSEQMTLKLIPLNEAELALYYPFANISKD